MTELLINQLTNTIGWELYADDGRAVDPDGSIVLTDEETERCRKVAGRMIRHFDVTAKIPAVEVTTETEPALGMNQFVEFAVWTTIDGVTTRIQVDRQGDQTEDVVKMIDEAHELVRRTVQGKLYEQR